MVADGNMQLDAAFREFKKASHPWKTEFDVNFNTYLLNGGIWGIGKKVMRKLKDPKYYVIVGGWNARCYVFAALYCAVTGRHFAIFTDTPRKTTPLNNFLKRIYFKGIFGSNRKAVLLVTGEYGVKQAIDTFGLSKTRVINFPWVTDNDFFSPPQEMPGKEELIVLCSVGRIDFAHKGQDLTLLALTRLRDEGVDNFIWNVAGTGKDLEELRVMIADQHMDKHVLLLDWLEPAEVRDLYKKSHFLVHSSHFDPYPNCVLEALSCGTPIIGSQAAGSVMDRVQSGTNGLVHSVEDIDELVECLRKGIELPQGEYIEWRKNARASALNWTVSYNLNVLSELLKRKHSTVT